MADTPDLDARTVVAECLFKSPLDKPVVAPLVATTAVDVALYILNQKRSHLNDIQQRYQVPIMVNADEDMHISQFVIERVAEGEITNGGGAVVHMDWAHHQEEPAQAAVPARAPAQAAEAEGEQGHRRSRRRRRRGGGRLHEGGAEHAHRAHAPEARQSEEEAVAAEGEVEEAASSEARAEPQVRKGSRRRGRRGGRRGRSRERQLGGQESAEAPRESHGEVQERKPAFTQAHVGETDTRKNKLRPHNLTISVYTGRKGADPTVFAPLRRVVNNSGQHA